MRMYKPTIHSYWLKSNFEHDGPIEIFVDRFTKSPVPKDTIRIIIIQEPGNQQLVNEMKNKDNYSYYTHVFTYHQEVLDVNNKAVYFLCVATWIKNFNDFVKKFSVSTVVGGKDRGDMDGYRIRHELWDRRNEIRMPKDFYLSSAYKYKRGDYKNSLVLPTELSAKSLMFDNEYHIAIENTKMKNVFSEKLLDCFRTKTIPIYYGATNISDFFDPAGIIVVNNVGDIIAACNELSAGDYLKRLDAVEKNYASSSNYLSTTEILDKKLLELLERSS